MRLLWLPSRSAMKRLVLVQGGPQSQRQRREFGCSLDGREMQAGVAQM
jgi:hypothetical protein